MKINEPTFIFSTLMTHWEQKQKEFPAELKYSKLLKYAQIRASFHESFKRGNSDFEVPVKDQFAVLLTDFKEEDYVTEWADANIKKIPSEKIKEALPKLYEKLSADVHKAFKEVNGFIEIPTEILAWDAFDILAVLSFLKKFELKYRKSKTLEELMEK